MSYIKKEWKVKDFQKGDLEFVKSLNHMEEGIASAGPGGEPDEYIKRAEVDGNKLTLTKKDDSQVIFEPQGGSEPTAYIKDAAVQDEKLTLTKKDGSLVELDVSTKAAQTDLDSEKDARVSGDEALQVAIDTKLAKPVEPVAGEGINVPYYFDVEYHETDAIVRDYTIDLLDNTKAPQQFALRITAASAQQAGLLQAGDKLKLDTLNQVEANPTLIGEEQELTGIQIGENKFKIPTGGSGEPAAYIKNAEISESGSTLTLTKKDDSTIAYEPNAYLPFPAEFITDDEHSVKEFINSVLSYSGFKAGKAWCGQLKSGDLPCGLIDAECTVIAVVKHDTSWQNNIAIIKLSSSNMPPYKWEYNTMSMAEEPDKRYVTWRFVPCIKESDCPKYSDTGDFDFVVSSNVSGGLKTKVVKSLTAGNNVTIDADRKINVDLSDKLDKPAEPVAGQGINVPYYFDVNYDTTKATVRDYTIDLLDKSKAPQQFSIDINSATQSTAGLMSASDKKVVDEMLPAYPTDTDAEYILAIKYENGAWKKYWKETVNKSDIVDSGMADYMVLKI